MLPAYNDPATPPPDTASQTTAHGVDYMLDDDRNASASNSSARQHTTQPQPHGVDHRWNGNNNTEQHRRGFKGGGRWPPSTHPPPLQALARRVDRVLTGMPPLPHNNDKWYTTCPHAYELLLVGWIAGADQMMRARGGGRAGACFQ